MVSQVIPKVTSEHLQRKTYLQERKFACYRFPELAKATRKGES